MTEALTAALECVIAMILAAHQKARDETRDVEKAALAMVELGISELVENMGNDEMMVDFSDINAATDVGRVNECKEVVQGNGVITLPAMMVDEVTIEPLDLTMPGPLDLSIHVTQEGSAGLAVQTSNPLVISPEVAAQPVGEFLSHPGRVCRACCTSQQYSGHLT